jgi:hypothetical protein
VLDPTRRHIDSVRDSIGLFAGLASPSINVPDFISCLAPERICERVIFGVGCHVIATCPT